MCCSTSICQCVLVTLQLLQELDQHNSYVNTLCFNQDGSLLYSGDSSGKVCVWNVCIEDGASLSGTTFFPLLNSADMVFELHQLLTE